MNDYIIFLIGISATFFSMWSTVPQIRKAVNTKKTDDVSRWLIISLIIGLSLWMLYGIIKHDVVIAFANAIGVTLVKIINERVSRNPAANKRTPKILICTPQGEYHSLGCMVIESFLRSKGYSVSNIAPSVPSDSVIAFASKYNPDLIMISITLSDNIGATNKLINKILDSSLSVSHILVGGIGIESIRIKNHKSEHKKVKFLKGTKLSSILPSIKEITNPRTKI